MYELLLLLLPLCRLSIHLTFFSRSSFRSVHAFDFSIHLQISTVSNHFKSNFPSKNHIKRCYVCKGWTHQKPLRRRKHRRNGKILEKNYKNYNCKFNSMELFTRSKSINKYVCTKYFFHFKFNSIIFEWINTHCTHTLFALWCLLNFISFFNIFVSLFTVPNFLIVEKETRKKIVAVH